MEHSRIKKRNVALIEKCVMSSIGIESLFRKFAGSPYKLHTYTSQESFQDAMSRISFTAVIFSFSAMRSERREGLSCLTELAIKFPRTRRLVIADDDIEARLIGSLSPSPLDGVLSKASTLEIFHQELFLSLNGVRQATDRLNNQWYINQSRTLSPTEREILRFMSRGYSMTQIAEQLKRNIKMIRAHKFNVMSKLGVSSDAGLLEAADILLCMRHCETSNVLHPY
ncbi:TPA: DNA-binding transcriptional activator BglJ [Escherichia coli]|uniref:DNA-binding transcriptional activator BglJ n=1 Tax=Escherichia coli TaxID=562 RepID=UPI0007A02A3F|nr:DNA-binding transcriptional activator BglJ [Escherichia coli]EHW2952214.1 DNA-binding transcriptional activator BglJ [Escherichia coli]EIQ9796730.1 DNA-binding transcriptional activator BglJ [Escherichia coli]EJJ5493408.1 DNA-binding transcriptional activator BglJ [Escherichia coli]KYV77144.1 helix-turn-helix transcriptional regulator [Escherichia coli]HAX2895303.1 DNA-binding transcriptional activator BglJ [Escherichia coli]